MQFTLSFLEAFLTGLAYGSPVLLFLVITIAAAGLWVGKKEAWSITDSLYYAFITATTVGYGDLHPSKGGGKLIAILIAITGILLTGIIVAIGLHAFEYAFVEIRQALDN